MGQPDNGHAPWNWTPQRTNAATLLAEDSLKDEQIAEECGIGRATLSRWKLRPEFAERVREIRGEIEQAILEQGIARRAERVRQLDQRWRKLRQIIDERAGDPEMLETFGGSTGLLTKTTKAVGYKDGEPVLVDEFSLDVGLLRELRELEKQAAQEMGDLQKHERESDSSERLLSSHPELDADEQLAPYLDSIRLIAESLLEDEEMSE